MTVCIAAVCNFGPNQPPVVVGVSDRMITAGDIEYEPDQTKTIVLATQTVALLAGDMELHADVAPKTLASLNTNPPPGFLVKDIAERYAQSFAEYRRRFAERELLFPLGLSIQDFISRQQEMRPEFLADLRKSLINYRIESETIIAGIDQTGAHIGAFIQRLPDHSSCAWGRQVKHRGVISHNIAYTIFRLPAETSG